MNRTFGVRLVGRDWRAGELRLLVAALVVAVATVTAISMFVDRLHQALLSESSNFLAADRYISGSREIPQQFVDEATARGLEIAQTMVFPSMVFAGNANQLVSVKAVSDSYPLRGRMIVADTPFGTGAPVDAVPQPGEIWLDSRLFPALDVQLGSEVEVGMFPLKVTRVLITEPDRGGSFFDLGPRLMMNLADVPATGVVQPGSRLSYRLLLAGEEATLESLREVLPLEPNFRWVSIRESSPAIGSALERAESFLLLGGLLGVLLAGVAVALSANRYARRHYDHVAVLKTLGATPTDVVNGFVVVLALVGGIAVLVGLLAGSALHLVIVAILGSMIPVSLPPPGMHPFVLGAATGLICTFAFALPPILHLRDVSPMRVIRRDLGVPPLSQWVSYGAAAAGGLALLLWYSGSVWLTAWTLLGTLGVLLVFGAMAWVVLGSTRVLGMQARSSWRLALAGLQRRRRENTGQILIFGLAIMLLLILVLLRTALLDEWRSQVPEEAPNHFVMNILPEEVAPIDAMLVDHATMRGGLYPMIRGRITAINEESAEAVSKRLRGADGDEDGPRVGSERNLTWMLEMPEDNRLEAGRWWDASAADAEVSLELDYANALGIQLGDVLTFDVGGIVVSAAVTSLRSLNWESMRPNFFIIFSPNVLEAFPATYLTSFYLPADDKIFLNTLLSRFPTVTVIEVDAIVAQVRTIVDRVTQAVELVLYLVLGSGALVLLASIQASRDTREAEHALIRALGGTRSLIAGSLALEFAMLGAAAGLVAAIGAELTVAVLHLQIFDLSLSLHPWLFLAGPLFGAVLIALVGVWGTRRLVSTPPMRVLRALG